MKAEEAPVADSSTLSALLNLAASFVLNSYDYMIVFGSLYLIYYYYKNNAEHLRASKYFSGSCEVDSADSANRSRWHSWMLLFKEGLPRWIISFLNVYTFGYKSEEAQSSGGEPGLLPLYRNRIQSDLNEKDESASPGKEALIRSETAATARPESPSKGNSTDNGNSLFSFVVCFGGLQISYLLWGLMQERIVKFGYEANLDKTSFKKFNNSQFLVLTNRFAGLVLSSVILIYCSGRKYEFLFAFRKLTSTRNWAPLFVCSFSSLSNVLSSWFQYESLKYVSFTSQLLAKSSKSIFVMIVGRVVNNKRYDLSEYVSVGVIGLGVFLFCDVDDMQSANSMITTTLPGLICLVGYLVSDGYTSNWQESLIKGYAMSSMTLMFMSNLYSCIFTFASLVHQDQLFESIAFLSEHKGVMNHIMLLSLTSAIGQIFIFITIQKFGALIFSLIMTTRQVLSIILSSLIYQHSLSLQSVIGIALIFTSLFVQQCLKLKSHTTKKSGAEPSAKSTNSKVVI